MPMALETGSLVEIRGERWLLTGVAPHGSCTVLTLEGRDIGNGPRRLRIIEPFDRPRRISSRKPRRRPRRAVLRAALRAIVDARPPEGLWTAADASIDLWPYQLEPALAVLNGATRLLLADAVGLGKTIQAGLVLSELRERGWIERALIVCPAGLRDTWARELFTRFGIGALVLDQAAIAERVATLPPGVNPWAGHAVAIASVDLVKRPEVLAAIASEPIDLLIADEAHHLTPGTERGAAVSRLASRATWCVLVSATPHSGDEAAFNYLTGIGARGDALAIFRRNRIEAGHNTIRRARVLAVAPTADEAALLSAIDQYARAIWRERGRDDHTARLLAMTLARRAASSSRAIACTLTRRLALLTPSPAEPIQPLLPWDDEATDLGESNELLCTPGLEQLDEERERLARLIQLAGRCERPAKLQRLMRLIDRIREPVVIFTEYRDSLDAVTGGLGATRRIAAIHGGVPLDQRRSTVDDFNAGRVDVLVATDAAGEGLNLHHRCRLVIDLELPWNPLRLEQRIGRVDRLGQQRIVHAIRLFHPRTIEERVLEHLRLRNRRAAQALDLPHITEAMVAGAVFDDTTIDVQVPQTIPTSRVAIAGAEAKRLEHQRRGRGAGARHAGGLIWTAPRNGRHVNVILVVRRSFMNASGGLVGDAVEARIVAVRPIANRREWQRLMTGELARLISSSVDDPHMAPGIEGTRAPIRARIDAIRGGRPRRVEGQSSLFDRRTEQALLAIAAAEQKLEKALTRIARTIAPPSPLRTRVELIAAWPWKPR